MSWTRLKTLMLCIRKVRTAHLYFPNNHVADEVTSIIFYTAAEANRPNKPIEKNSLLGLGPESLVEVSEKKLLRKLLIIMDNVFQPLHATSESVIMSLSYHIQHNIK